ncbi:MAG: Na+/H+ antiporter [Burkholderiaceae bacterium]
MPTVSVVLAMLAAVVASGYLVRVLPIPLPLPLVQIALGAAIASVANLGVQLKPELFFLLFLPPLLFLDGWRIPKSTLFRDKTTVLALALGLVVFTVLGLGYLMHWLIPGMPLPVAFALAAVLSPTDPVAVSAIAERIPIPKRMMHILQGESLLNDASGLVCLRFAVAAAITGSFSLPQAFLTFLWLAIGGIVIGVAATWGTMQLKIVLTRRFGEESGSQVLISLLIPFGAYLLAEHLGCSGILAAVAAGITMSYAEISGRALAATRMHRTAVWDSLQFAANGAIFVLLGEQLPGILDGAVGAVLESGHDDPWWLAIYALAITLTLAGLRFIWVWLSLALTLFRAHRNGHSESPLRLHWRPILAMSVAGVRGAVTLAGVLTLPLALPDGSPFPARELSIFLAASVIILSLIVASVALPRLLRGLHMPPEPSRQADEDQARAAAAEAAIRAIERTHHQLAAGRDDADLYADAAARLMEVYRRRIEEAVKTGEDRAMARHVGDIERRLRLAALDAERDEVFRIARAGRIGDETARRLVRELDLLDARYGGERYGGER